MDPLESWLIASLEFSSLRLLSRWEIDIWFSSFVLMLHNSRRVSCSGPHLKLLHIASHLLVRCRRNRSILGIEVGSFKSHFKMTWSQIILNFLSHNTLNLRGIPFEVILCLIHSWKVVSWLLADLCVLCQCKIVSF